jgi:SAM-dependent methyltransferase
MSPDESLTTAIDLGSGSTPRNHYGAHRLIALDCQDLSIPNYKRCRLGIDSLPFADQQIDYFTAFDAIEHVPRVLWRDGELINPFIFLMSEIFRCLKPGGLFYAETPAYPHGVAFQDPTHVNILTEESIYYFCPRLDPNDPNINQLLKQCQAYGFSGSFELISQTWRGAHLIWEIKK